MGFGGDRAINKITLMESFPGKKKNEQNIKYKKYKGVGIGGGEK